MINNFIIKAIPGSNILKVILDGIFMKSEIELALLLIRAEKLKLKQGYKVVSDIKNLKTKGTEFRNAGFRIQQEMKSNIYPELIHADSVLQ